MRILICRWTPISRHSALRIVAALLALVCCLSPLFATSASAAKYREGDIVTFGSYEQDNITSKIGRAHV